MWLSPTSKMDVYSAPTPTGWGKREKYCMSLHLFNFTFIFGFHTMRLNCSWVIRHQLRAGVKTHPWVFTSLVHSSLKNRGQKKKIFRWTETHRAVSHFHYSVAETRRHAPIQQTAEADEHVPISISSPCLSRPWLCERGLVGLNPNADALSACVSFLPWATPGCSHLSFNSQQLWFLQLI